MMHSIGRLSPPRGRFKQTIATNLCLASITDTLPCPNNERLS